MVDANREFSNRGKLNDFVENLMKICQQAFNKDELLGDEPNHWAKVDPEKVDIPDIPALYVWMDGVDTNNHSLGQQRSDKELTEKFEIQLKIRYIVHKVNGEERAEEVRETADLLLEHLIANKNINDLSEITNIGRMDFSTSLLFVNNKLQPVDGFEVSITCTFQERMKQSTRINDRYK